MKAEPIKTIAVLIVAIAIFLLIGYGDEKIQEKRGLKAACTHEYSVVVLSTINNGGMLEGKATCPCGEIDLEIDRFVRDGCYFEDIRLDMIEELNTAAFSIKTRNKQPQYGKNCN